MALEGIGEGLREFPRGGKEGGGKDLEKFGEAEDSLPAGGKMEAIAEGAACAGAGLAGAEARGEERRAEAAGEAYTDACIELDGGARGCPMVVDPVVVVARRLGEEEAGEEAEGGAGAEEEEEEGESEAREAGTREKEGELITRNTQRAGTARENDLFAMPEAGGMGARRGGGEALHAVRGAVRRKGSISFKRVSTLDLLASVVLVVARGIVWCGWNAGVM